VVDTPENCDDSGESASCDDDCTFVTCGDSNVNPGCVASVCGDVVV
jgi:hypothetical protein